MWAGALPGRSTRLRACAGSGSQERKLLDVAGGLLEHFGRHSDALKALDEAVALDPQRVEAWAGKGDVHMQLDEYEKPLNA